jgi:hypothetical protein
MKKLIFLFAILISGISAYSQNENIENARWVNGYYQLEKINPNVQFYQYVLKSTTKYCTSAQDTLINTQEYLQLFNCSAAINYRGALRVAGQKWYFVAKDSTAEMLLYDFGLALGDTLKNPFFTETARYNSFGWPLVVTLVDTITVFGANYKRIQFDYNLSWVEGVGSPRGLLWDNFANISSFQQALECFNQADSLQFSAATASYQPDSLNTACPLNLPIAPGKRVVEKLQVYPNPAKDHLWLEWGAFSGSYAVEILTLDGRVLSTALLTQAKSRLELNLQPGLYVLRYRDGSNFDSKIFSVQP